jgi:hypothetical protein
MQAPRRWPLRRPRRGVCRGAPSGPQLESRYGRVTLSAWVVSVEMPWMILAPRHHDLQPASRDPSDRRRLKEAAGAPIVAAADGSSTPRGTSMLERHPVYRKQVWVNSPLRHLPVTRLPADGLDHPSSRAQHHLTLIQEKPDHRLRRFEWRAETPRDSRRLATRAGFVLRRLGSE